MGTYDDDPPVFNMALATLERLDRVLNAKIAAELNRDYIGYFQLLIIMYKLILPHVKKPKDGRENMRKLMEEATRKFNNFNKKKHVLTKVPADMINVLYSWDQYMYDLAEKNGLLMPKNVDPRFAGIDDS